MQDVKMKMADKTEQRLMVTIIVQMKILCQASPDNRSRVTAKEVLLTVMDRMLKASAIPIK